MPNGSPIASHELVRVNPNGGHTSDQECQAYAHRASSDQVEMAQTNGMVERFNGRISDVLAGAGSETQHEAMQLPHPV